LDVLEKAGFCKNVTNIEVSKKVDNQEETIILNPTIYKGVALYGYPGKKSGLEIPELRKIKLNDSPGMFKIFLLHTTIDKAKGTLPIDAIEVDLLPKADYYALGHLHIDFKHNNFVYPGPVFPNNFQELKDLKNGSFYFIDTDAINPLRKIDLKIKEIVYVKIEINNALIATEKIISEIEKHELKDKILLLKIRGVLENGKISDIKFSKIEDFVKNKGAYFLLKNTHDLKAKEVELEIKVSNNENVEEETIKQCTEQNPSDFNKLIPRLLDSFSIEKQEDEKVENFTNRIMNEARSILNI
jgi:DNA repair exonuclease SbcCD nuclease subunit